MLVFKEGNSELRLGEKYAFCVYPVVLFELQCAFIYKGEVFLNNEKFLKIQS